MNSQQSALSLLRQLLFHTLLLTVILFQPCSATAAVECFDCHGSRSTGDFRPQDDAQGIRNPSTGAFKGNHQSHLPAGATAQNCEPCHPGSSSYTSSHRNGLISIATNLNNSSKQAVYGHYSSINTFTQTPNPLPVNCTNVNCHFETVTPVWGSRPPLPADECTTCHGAPPPYGAHGKKHAEYFGTGLDSCANCHRDHRLDADPHAHAMESGKRPLAVQFTKSPNSGGTYSGDISYPNYLPSNNPTRNGTCTDLYCHSDGQGRGPTETLTWSGSETTSCISCHRGRTNDSKESVMMNMTSNGHHRLVGGEWIRKYPCTYCHNATIAATVDANGKITGDGPLVNAKHVNGTKDVSIALQWRLVGGFYSYSSSTKTCYNVYCHSDGSADYAPPISWKTHATHCNSCHGHPKGTCTNASCHDGRIDEHGKEWKLPDHFRKEGTLNEYHWPPGEEWKSAIPMFQNEGAGKLRSNSHTRHIETNFTCDKCHANTIVNGVCTDCHQPGISPFSMREVAHITPQYHVNKSKDITFKDGGSYNTVTKTCSNTRCHTGGADPAWGDSVNGTVICLSCHGTTNADVDDLGAIFNGTQAKINLTDWVTKGHGRYSSSGNYPGSGNPAANFPGNPCWYCHDNNVLHNYSSNPFRLRLHNQFSRRFDKECVYCHMEGTVAECLACHDSGESLAPQVRTSTVIARHSGNTHLTGCRNLNCHDTDARLHKSGAGFWSGTRKADVRNQYLMMGVCLKCHDDDTGGKCTQCHTNPPENGYKYSIGFDPGLPGSRFIKPKKARATSVHFGYKHYRGYQQNGIWKGGKFCWDCHDPHGDKNIYMIQDKVATSTDGRFGKPVTTATVTFTRKQSGLDYARTSAPYDGICNVCHSAGSQHFRMDGGDGHNTSRVCTTCHEHRFSDSHANNKSCASCHANKPVPRHSGFGLPRDCTKCHAGAIGLRMDVMGQFKANSHHVQGVEVSNSHCYACHWESTPDGLIDTRYHEGYNYKSYTTVKNAKVDLVAWGPNRRPTWYNTTTAVQFTASKVGSSTLSVSRAESGKLNRHCISCHSDQNNDTTPFSDCKTPRQYAWDFKSIDARYSQTGTTTWGKYAGSPNAAPKNLTKALSAHGNAVANAGGFDAVNGVDTAIANTRGGSYNVTCFDCHNSHGSRVTGVTSGYETFNGTKNGGNLKDTQAGKGGYAMSYRATSNSDSGSINPYNAGAGQCFDCHLTQNSGTTPWGYQTTFGASQPIRGYMDTPRFGTGTPTYMQRYPYKTTSIKGGHFKASSAISGTPDDTINGLCTPCHDPHGVSPAIQDGRQAYAVPLLKGTWMTSQYKEDVAAAGPTSGQMPGSGRDNGGVIPIPTVFTDDKAAGTVSEDESKFAGLCLRCHSKSSLTNGTNHTWKSRDRVHESVKGWKTANGTIKHNFTCAKCHAPHVTALPRLMQTNCLNTTHRGRVASGGSPGSGSRGSFPYGEGSYGANCHPTGSWPDNRWNGVTPW